MKHLSAASEVAQIVGGIAVVASLIYVGSEIRANTAATQAATRQAVAESDFTYFEAMIDADVLIEATVKSFAGDSLTATEALMLGQHQALNFRVFENAYYQSRTGLLTEETWQRYQRIIAFLLRESAPAQSMWTSTEWTFDQSFREEVGRILADPPSGLPTSECASNSMGNGSVDCG